MSNKFGKIKTADELEKAILYVKANQRALGTGIGKDARHLLDSMKPSNLVNNFVSSFVPATTLSDAGMGLVQGIKKIFTAPDKPKSERKAKRKAKKEASEESAWEAEVVEEAAETVAESVAEAVGDPAPETQAD